MPIVPAEPLNQQPTLPGVLTPEQKQRIIDAVAQKGAVRPCQRCGVGAQTILDFIFAPSAIAPFTKQIQLGGPSIPVIGIACTGCGAITYHALGILMPLKEFGLE